MMPMAERSDRDNSCELAPSGRDSRSGRDPLHHSRSLRYASHVRNNRRNPRFWPECKNQHLSLAAAAIAVAAVVLQIGPARSADTAGPRIYSLEPVPISDVDITDQFWAPKMQVNRTVSIQHLFKKFGD